MPKKIAVLVRDRQDEALRMALGVTLLEDAIDVYILDGPVGPSEDNIMNIETMKDMGMSLYTNYPDKSGGLTYISTAEMAKRLTGYDLVLPY
ncbi:MAG: hypothetical protein M0Z75_00890 [Nitrospiraceae bacterium]|nr:hypothetical protein [Nitrospiraceae bacterium]